MTIGPSAGNILWFFSLDYFWIWTVITLKPFFSQIWLQASSANTHCQLFHQRTRDVKLNATSSSLSRRESSIPLYLAKTLCHNMIQSSRGPTSSNFSLIKTLLFLCQQPMEVFLAKRIIRPRCQDVENEQDISESSFSLWQWITLQMERMGYGIVFVHFEEVGCGRHFH